MVIPESQIRALIRLLADEDEKIVQTISGRLIDIGPSAVPLLQEAEIEQPEMAERIASVLEEIRGGKLEDELITRRSPTTGWTWNMAHFDRALCLSRLGRRGLQSTARRNGAGGA